MRNHGVPVSKKWKMKSLACKPNKFGLLAFLRDLNIFARRKRFLYMQARSQDLEKGGGGGLFWKSEKSANDLDPNFDCSWNQFHTVCPKIQTKFLGKLGNSKVFSAQNQVVSKTKKTKKKVFAESLIFQPKSEIQRFFPPKNRWSPRKKVFAKLESDFSAEIRNSKVFSAQNRWSPKKKKKKKKRSSPKLSLIFRPNSEIQTFQGGCFLMGGAIFNFSQKIGLKSIKKCDFEYFTSQWGGGSSPPAPPGYATVYTYEPSMKAVPKFNAVAKVICCNFSPTRKYNILLQIWRKKCDYVTDASQPDY